ncbi:MAG TPA: STT3 domain-containing protein [Thermoanaerobaculia bacterium]|nr:STT3 domain-containing protein [Thermoanaerobaculia bacterium]
MTAPRAALLLGLAAALAIGVGLRLSTYRQLQSGPRVRPLTVDDNYHLRRARFAVAHYPRTIVFDPLMNFPEGGVPIWPPLFDVALATPSRILHGAAATPATIEREAAWVPLAFAAGAILLAGLLGVHLAGAGGGVCLALFLAVSPGHLLWTQYGHSDQHVAESFFGLAVLLLFVKCRDLPEPRLGKETATGVALALAVLTWQGAICWGAVFAFALLLEALVTGRSVLRPTLAVLGLAALLVGLATAAWLQAARTPFTYISFGFFQPAFLAALACGTLLLETGLRAFRRQLSQQERRVRIAALLAAGIVVVPFARDLLTGSVRGLGYVLGITSEASGPGGYLSYPRDWLKGIFEARPLLADGPGLAWKQLSAAFFLTPLILLLWAARAARGVRPATHITLGVWGGVTLLLALSQRLNVYYAAPLAGLCLVEAARFCRARVREPAVGAAAVAVLVGLALALPMAPGIREEVSAVRVPGSDLYTTLAWMRQKLPHAIDAYDPRLLGPATGPPDLSRAASVLAPWSLGHLILYETELPVVANNFGYGFLDSMRFFLAESEPEALALAAHHRSRWVLATDLVPRLNDYAKYLGRPPYVRQTPQGPAATPAYFRTLQARLYDFDGAGVHGPESVVEPLAHFRLRFHSQSAIFRGGRWIALWKVFEIVDEPLGPIPDRRASRHPPRAAAPRASPPPA